MLLIGHSVTLTMGVKRGSAMLQKSEVHKMNLTEELARPAFTYSTNMRSYVCF